MSSASFILRSCDAGVASSCGSCQPSWLTGACARMPAAFSAPIMQANMSTSAASCFQAKALGEHLVVGLIPDSEIRRCKGPPVMSDDERHTMVESVKWVDEVLTGESIRS